ncbi:MAG: right-handed parallel beta-helix repeat-containing protein [Candidatus Cloacimonetes bacterium]|nr:right-handed parallel beta-helix repeat-containing protein [Candidatus Cloacimonadota bacterium]
MKKLLLSFCLLLLIISASATDVLGNQSGTWNLAGSPYNVVGEITVPTNETLQIEAGVEVIAMGNYKITALGNILASGALNDTIRFYGNGELNWGGLRLEDEVTTSQFDYCRISNTDDTNDYGIQSINSPVLINYSYFDDHQKAISFSALSATTPSYMEIKNSKIAYVQKSGITIVDNSNVLIDSCEVTQCGLGASFYGAIQLSLQSNSHSCSPTITNNYIHHNDKQGITLANLFGYDNMAPTVEYNEVSYNYTGIYLYVGKGTYKWNHIHHNFVENNPDSGAGVMLYGDGADAVFTYNEINNNYTGFYLTADATVNLGDLNNTDPEDDGYNCIYDNIFYTGEEYSIYNTSSVDVTAENCVWDDDPPIDVSIIDGNDNPAYGIVDYEPTLSTFAPADYINIDLENYTISPGLVAYPTYATLSSWNLYRDGVLMGMFAYPYSFIPIYGQEVTYSISINYDDPVGESAFVDTTIFIPHILNPVLNANVTEYGYVTWEEPEPGSTSPFLHFNIYLNGSLQGSTTELFYQLMGLVNGEQYFVGLSAQYEAGESDILEFELPYVNSDENTFQMSVMLNNYPNPFNPTTTISFSVTQTSSFVTLEIYNLKGQRVKTFSPSLCHPELVEGRGQNIYNVVWNGTDQNNQPVSSGVYFYKLVSNGKDIASKKMLLLK